MKQTYNFTNFITLSFNCTFRFGTWAVVHLSTACNLPVCASACKKTMVVSPLEKPDKSEICSRGSRFLRLPRKETQAWQHHWYFVYGGIICICQHPPVNRCNRTPVSNKWATIKQWPFERLETSFARVFASTTNENSPWDEIKTNQHSTTHARMHEQSPARRRKEAVELKPRDYGAKKKFLISTRAGRTYWARRSWKISVFFKHRGIVANMRQWLFGTYSQHCIFMPLTLKGVNSHSFTNITKSK